MFWTTERWCAFEPRNIIPHVATKRWQKVAILCKNFRPPTKLIALDSNARPRLTDQRAEATLLCQPTLTWAKMGYHLRNHADDSLASEDHHRQTAQTHVHKRMGAAHCRLLALGIVPKSRERPFKVRIVGLPSKHAALGHKETSPPKNK